VIAIAAALLGKYYLGRVHVVIADLQTQTAMTDGAWQYVHDLTYPLAVTVTLLVIRGAVKKYFGEFAERIALIAMVLLPLWAWRDIS
jgi:hypothetical protein